MGIGAFSATPPTPRQQQSFMGVERAFASWGRAPTNMRLACALCVLTCFAPKVLGQVVVTSVGMTQQQAVLKISGSKGACTLELSESSTFVPSIPDADPTKYAL